ncbi:hypothetical protein OK016_14645 [Vibrio chagasii]|nr:hypothetical protein [Vibrio chagasii]
MDDAPDEFETLKKKIEKSKMPPKLVKKPARTLQKLKMMSPMSAGSNSGT